MDWYSYSWLIFAVVLFIIEAMVPGLISIWFAIGALFGLLCCLLHLPVWLQISVFIIVSFVCLILTRPLVKKYLKPSIQPTNVDALIGKSAIVTSPILAPMGIGEITVDGQIWSAVADDYSISIEKGTLVSIIRIEGVKCIVTKSI